jgi:DNA polymerase-3 subunit gamma/tau
VSWGSISYAPTADAPADLPSRLGRALEEVTGQRWSIRTDAASGAETIAARRAREAAERLEALTRHPFVAQALTLFPGSAVRAVEEEPPPVDTPAAGAEIVPLPRRAAKGE